MIGATMADPPRGAAYGSSQERARPLAPSDRSEGAAGAGRSAAVVGVECATSTVGGPTLTRASLLGRTMSSWASLRSYLPSSEPPRRPPCSNETPSHVLTVRWRLGSVDADWDHRPPRYFAVKSTHRAVR